MTIGELYKVTERYPELDATVLRRMLVTSLDEGYDFVQRLIREYQSGVEKFDMPGSVLLGADDTQGIAVIGGVGIDPYEKQPTIGRIRHVYVLPPYRRVGMGSRLMHGLIDHARGHYTTLTLRTLTPHGDAFYRELGFQTEKRFQQATHWMDL